MLVSCTIQVGYGHGKAGILVTVLLLKFVTQTLCPSKAISRIPAPASTAPKTVPVRLTLVRPLAVVAHRFVPSNTIELAPTANVQVPTHAPSLARSLVKLA